MIGIIEGYGIITEIFPNRNKAINPNLSLTEDLLELESVVNYDPITNERVFNISRYIFIPRFTMDELKCIIRDQFNHYNKKFPHGRPTDFINSHYVNDSYWTFEFFHSFKLGTPAFFRSFNGYDIFWDYDSKERKSIIYIGLERHNDYTADENFHYHWTFLKEYESLLTSFRYGQNTNPEWFHNDGTNTKRETSPNGRIIIGKLFLTGEAEKEYKELGSWRRVAEKFNLKSYNGQFSATFKRENTENENDVFQTHQEEILQYCYKNKIKIIDSKYIRK